jgi:hypothetical protein
VNKLTFFWLLRDERFDLTGPAVLARWLRDDFLDLSDLAERTDFERWTFFGGARLVPPH